MSKSIEKDRRSGKRLRPEEIETVIIDTVFEDLQEHGFRAVTVDSISAKTGIAKTSIYRRWPNKAAMVMEAFLFRIGPGIEFPRNSSYVESISLKMLGLAKAFFSSRRRHTRSKCRARLRPARSRHGATPCATIL